MKAATLTIIVSFFTATLFSQVPQLSWAYGIGGSSTDYPESMVIDDTGNVYLIGQFQFTVDFDPGPGVYNLTSPGGYEIYVLKLNSNGNFIWAKRFGGTGTDGGRSIALDNMGNVIITGYYVLTADFDPGPSSYNLTSQGAGDIFICKLDNGGNFLWVKTFGGVSNEYPESINCDGAGNIISTGYFPGTVDFNPGPGVNNLSSVGMNDGYISKLDPAGNFIWAKNIGGTGQDIASNISIDYSNNLYINGVFYSTVDFDPGPGTFNLTPFGSGDIYILKLNSTGNFEWAKKMGGTGLDEVFGLALDTSGSVYSTGNFIGTADFDPGPGVQNLSSAGMEDIYISKLDSLGNFVWCKKMGGPSTEEGENIAVDQDGTIYVTGYFNGTADFDPGLGTYNLSSMGIDDIFVTILNPSGNLLSAMSAGSPTGDLGACISLDTSGSFFLAARYSATIDVDFGPGIYNVPTNGTFDILIAKYATCTSSPTQPSSVNGPSNVCLGSQYIYSIAPLSTANTYSWDLPVGWIGNSTDTSITVIAGNASGNISVIANNGCGSSPQQIINVNVNTLPVVIAQAADTVLCFGENIILSGIGASFYAWNNGVVDSVSFIPLLTNTYTVIGTDVNGCTNSDAITIAVNPLPLVSANATDVNVCVGDSTTLTGGGAISYTWSNGVTDGITFSPHATATYMVTGTDLNTCTNTDSINIIVNTLPLIFASATDTILCNGEFTALTGSGGISYNWNGGVVNGLAFSPTLTATYIVVGTDGYNCSDTATIDIIVNDLPTVMFNYSGPDTVCTTDTLQILNSGSPLGGAYTGPGVIGTDFDPTVAGAGTHVISYTFTDGNNCTNSDSIFITVIICSIAGTNGTITDDLIVYPNPFETYFSIDGLTESSTVQLTNSIGKMIRTWQTNESNPTFHIENLSPGIYFLNVGRHFIKLMKQ
jgi:hypothetical protein